MELLNEERELLVSDRVVLDDSMTEMLAPLQPPPGVRERLRTLEDERQQAVSQMHRMVVDIRALKDGHQRWARELDAAQADTMYRLALVVEDRNGGTPSKILRIGLMSAILAHAMGCEESFCDEIQLAAPLHDIGEIALPDRILEAPVLGDIERELMRNHCRLGHALLVDSVVPELRLAAEIALNHHERFNGRGYPNRLQGDEIPLAARIVALIDCFDALTLKRPYREAYPAAVAVQMVLAGTGAQFDPVLVEVFRRISESIVAVRWLFDDAQPRPEARKWLGGPPERGLWKRFV